MTNVTFYKVDFDPSKNARVDSFASYLQAKTIRTVEFQYVKHSLNLEIKVNLNQSEVNDLQFNYVGIKNDSDKRTYYYFIIRSGWLATNTINLVLSMDTINTFYSELVFDNRTNVIRQHQDRFVEEKAGDYVITLKNKIDKVDEGISGLVKFNDGNKIEIEDPVFSGERFYLIYNTDKNISLNSNEIVPISCYLCTSNRLELATRDQRITLNATDLQEPVSMGSLDKKFYQYIFTYYFAANQNKSIIAGGRQYKITQNQSVSFFRGSNNKITLDIINNADGSRQTYNDLADITLVDAQVAVTAYTNEISSSVLKSGWYDAVNNRKTIKYYNAGTPMVTLASIKDIDRTLSTLVKIIELPYSPVQFATDSTGNPMNPEGWTIVSDVLGSSYPLLKLRDLNTEFMSPIVTGDSLADYTTTEIPTITDRIRELRNKKYETKLNNSSFTTLKYLYDTFSKEIRFEDISLSTLTPQLSIYFKPSNALVSNMIFDFTISNASVLYREDYGRVLMANRNNDYPLYNSSYINYLRTGYQYEQQRNANQKQDNWVGFGFNLAGTAAAAAASLIPGGQAIGLAATMTMGLNTLQNIRNNIDSSLQADERLQQSLDQARQQSASIVGSTDLNLFNYYSGNNLVRIEYKLSERTEQNIYDLFFYTGYSVNKRMIPNTNSRRCFNFIQCEPVFTNENEPELQKYMEDIKARFKAGVTVYHKFGLLDQDQSLVYDFKQEYENWETWICPRLP